MTKKYFFLLLIVTSILILSFAKNSFSENLLVLKNAISTEVSGVKDIKPDISIEITPSQHEEDEFDEEFDDIDYGTEEEPFDPIEPFNRLMWKVNEKLYDYALEPVARGYAKIFPKQIRKMVGNLFSNAASPVYLVSSILQLKMEKINRTLGRFLINSTLGVGGLFDPASRAFHIKKVNEDIDQALGYYDVPSGPFFILPIFGPLTLRGMVAKVPETFLSPLFIFGVPVLTSTGVRGVEVVNGVSFNLGAKEDLDMFAIDPYTSVKDYYFQRRKILIKE